MIPHLTMQQYELVAFVLLIVLLALLVALEAWVERHRAGVHHVQAFAETRRALAPRHPLSTTTATPTPNGAAQA